MGEILHLSKMTNLKSVEKPLLKCKPYVNRSKWKKPQISFGLGFYGFWWRDYSMIWMGNGLKVKAHRRCAAHRTFFCALTQTTFGFAAEKKPGAMRWAFYLVGMARFELTTPCTPCKCATGLRYIPIFYVGCQQNPGEWSHGNGSPFKGWQK